jgi:putative nucleotidyltransferase with HDIG domain
MSKNNDNDQGACFVTPDQLRIGLYVHLDTPWFRHSFTLNRFRIASAQQIVELQALGQQRFRFDPALSRTLPSPEELPVESASQVDELVTCASASAPPPLDHVLAGKVARMERLAEQRMAICRIEKSFAKVSTVMRSLNKNLLLRPKETLEEMGGMVDQMVSVFLDNPEVTLQVLSDKSGGEERYYHGLNVSVLCLMLAKVLGLESAQARLLGTGALLHDIGLSEIPDRVLKKPPSEQTKPERELRALHVEYGVTQGQRLGLPPAVLAIIGQHHELADGSGYPKGLKQEEISPLARIVSLVNFYDNLCNPVEVASALTPHEALSFMFAQRRAKFDAKVLQALVHSLGVYPPGSVVKLSNDAIAMVVSVNPKKSLRPWVLIYDPGVPREEAIMLDLEMEPTLSIRQAIRPALLLPPVYAYLCPRKRVTYFFDGKSSIEKATG